MPLQELVGDLMRESERIRTKANYMRCMEGVSEFKLNFEGSQSKSAILEEVAAILETTIAKYIVETDLTPNRQINTLLRNRCIGKLVEIPMSKI